MTWICAALLAAWVAPAFSCSRQLDPSGRWSRHQDLFVCDWEGGRNHGQMTFTADGAFSEKLFFRNPRPYSTSARGRWWVQGEILTLDLTELSGRDEVAPPDEHIKLLFKAAHQDEFLFLTLTTIIHDDTEQGGAILTSVPDAERCTAIYEPWSERG